LADPHIVLIKVLHTNKRTRTEVRIFTLKTTACCI